MSVTVAIQLKEIPKSCDECKFYSNVPYRVHNESGTEAHCDLGYMNGDMRDVNFRTTHKGELYSGCRIKDNVISTFNDSIH